MTDAEKHLLALCTRYITAKETPGVPSERLYHKLRRAVERVKQEKTDG